MSRLSPAVALLGLLITVCLPPSTNAAPSGSAPSAASSMEHATPVPEVTVKGKEDAFVRSDRKLAEIKNNLPTLGTDRPAQVTFVDRAAAYYGAHRDPNQLEVLDQEMLLRMLGIDSFGTRLTSNTSP